MISAPTIARMANGLKSDVSAFAAMTTWLRMPAETLYATSTPQTRGEGEPELLASLVPLLRAPRDLDESESHALVGRRSNIAHELGHHLLEHPFDKVILGEDHKRQLVPGTAVAEGSRGGSFSAAAGSARLKADPAGEERS